MIKMSLGEAIQVVEDWLNRHTYDYVITKIDVRKLGTGCDVLFTEYGPGGRNDGGDEGVITVFRNGKMFNINGDELKDEDDP